MGEHAQQGLSSAEAERRLAQYGPNALPPPSPLGVFSIVLRTLKEPMFFLLVAAAALYLAVGDLGEGLFMVVGAGASITLVVVQELRTERALQALRAMAEPMAHALRDGEQKRIPARDLVPGDIILVGEGERLPADAWLRGGDALTVDESALTGESAPVTKTIDRSDPGPIFPDPGGDNTPFLYSGTMITRGAGVGEVARTGVRTALGAVGASLASIETEPTPLQRTTGALAARLGVLALIFCALVVLAYGLVHGDWIEGGFAGITLAIGLLPEEFPMVLAIFLALGSWRLAKRNILVRRSAATETLGSASILCVDKTGTLTQNRMRVAEVSPTPGHCERSEAIQSSGAAPGSLRFARDDDAGGRETLIRAALRACAQNPVDPMDRAVHALAREANVEVDGAPIESYPIRPERLAFIQKWRLREGDAFAAKGAPEAIFHLAKLDDAAREPFEKIVGDMARRGLRVLAVAEAPAGARDATAASFELRGFLAFEDPVREEVPRAVADARRAGVAVAMITGDYPATALAIAREAGLDASAGCLSGDDIAAMEPAQLREAVRKTRVFARVTPNAKLAIVEAFKANGHIVAMTGDGVNDGPALAAAHIGVAMGQRGSDVAREAAAIVLLDDSFASIVAGIRMGRRIFANLRRALTFILAIHVPIAGLALLPILMGLPPLLLPAHVVMMELVIDPTCSLVFEGEPSESDSMVKPPRRVDESLFGARDVAVGVVQGVAVLLAVLSVYVIELGLGAPEPQARGLAYAALILGNLSLALADALPRGVSAFARENRVFWIIAAIAGATIAASLYAPWLAGLMHFEPPGWGDLILFTPLAILAGGWYGVWKRLADA